MSVRILIEPSEAVPIIQRLRNARNLRPYSMSDVFVVTCGDARELLLHLRTYRDVAEPDEKIRALLEMPLGVAPGLQSFADGFNALHMAVFGRRVECSP